MNLSKTVSRVGLKLQKHSPEILFGAGIVGMIGTVVLASRATLKLPAVNEQHKKEITYADRFHQEGKYDDDTRKQAIVSTWVMTSKTYVKLYGPAFILGVTSIACLTKSHQILQNRNNALMAAYAAVDGAFKKYRSRVVQELGQEKDLEFLNGSEEKTITGYDEKGNGVAKAVKVPPKDAKGIYGRWFDEGNRNWDKHPGYNYNFLDNQQEWCNIKLKSRGHLFLNEVYDILGFERTKEGNMVGWVYDTPVSTAEGQVAGDGYVDFGFRFYPDFMAGYERSVFLDFNVDGVILDKI